MMKIYDMRWFLVFAIAALLASPAAADTATPGPKAIIARAGTSALILLDVTTTVADATKSHTPHDQTMTQLETLALQTLRTESDRLPHSAMLTARVLYDKIAALNPAYNVATYAGAEKVFEMTISRQALLSQYDALAAQIAHGTVTAPLKIDVTGELPPV
jgi:hypothetical protein